MKKLITTMFAVSFILLLAACSSSDADVNDLFNKSMEAAKDLNSFSVDMVMDQTIEVGTESMPQNMEIYLDMVQEPLTMYQQMSISMGDMMNIDTESYFTDEGFFMYDSMSNMWQKLPSEQFENIMQMADNQQSPINSLKQMEKFVDDFELIEEDSQYIFKLSSTDEKMKDLITSMIPQDQLAGAGMADDIDQLMENMTISTLEYEITIDKETYYPKNISMIMDSTMTMEGETVGFYQEMTGEYSNFNEVNEISVPDEVINTATESPF
ncbi:DUF6612 family protein [Bacillus sp. SCS-151]|uniref:DUF6612 family protein n=1 Tax=Nanhaiella sioensis TaxID=3115293 RepID=UPI00397AE8BB